MRYFIKCNAGDHRGTLLLKLPPATRAEAMAEFETWWGSVAGQYWAEPPMLLGKREQGDGSVKWEVILQVTYDPTVVPPIDAGRYPTIPNTK